MSIENSPEGENGHFASEETLLIQSSLEPRDNFWLNPWLFSVTTTLVALLPALVLASVFTYELSGRLWPATFASLHMSLALGSAFLQLLAPARPDDDSSMNRSSRWLTSLGSILDIVLCRRIYPSLASSFDFMFEDIDGTPVDEWHSTALLLQTSRVGFNLVVWSRVMVGGATWLEIMSRSSPRWNHFLEQANCDYIVHKIVRVKLNEFLKSVELRLPIPRSQCKSRLLSVVKVLGVMSMLWLLVCVQACISHLTDWPGLGAWNADDAMLGNRSNACCDIMDPTECSLPFPSFHHMVQDNTTKTGWRVALHSDSLPFLRGGIPLDPGFWNELDGFSTMAPILFYGLEGLKESHEAKRRGSTTNVYPRLVEDNVRESVTHKSVTLLWDVDRSKLIAHTAQFDDLDSLRPLIMMVPAQPLHHGTHYGVAVINATDVHGERIPQTLGMKSLFDINLSSETTCVRDYDRVERYHSVLLSSLQQAAPWLLEAGSRGLTDGSIQLMFDFVTMSRDSLSTIERVRDATMEAISSWDSHQVEVIRIEDHDCSDNATLVARTVHGSIRVPWFLESSSRGAMLSKSRLPMHGARLPDSRAKFVVRIPCCLKAAALGWNDTFRLGKPLRAIVDYGHGLFFNRVESYDQALSRVGEDNGYIIMAMDWRGMSSFDLPVVVKTLLGQPKLFQATRDNIIQGYANKIVLQHYSNSEMLNATWLRFSESHRRRRSPTFPIPLLGGNNDTRPASVFYGSSQGGILGAGYTTLLGETGLIDRGVLGVPGTSFSLVLSRTADFAAYDSLLLRNFYQNRQVRLILSIVQLGWDPVEAAGLLAPPVKPGSFPPMLLQSGLGDPVVPTTATEALARAYNASILHSNPRTEIFGISKVDPFRANSSTVFWTELLYENEYQHLPFDNIFPDETTILVHACLRQDCPLIHQLAEFVNTGRIIDPCIHDGCLRTKLSCYMPWMNIESRPRNWNCSSCSSLDNHTRTNNFSIDSATCYEN